MGCIGMKPSNLNLFGHLRASALAILLLFLSFPGWGQTHEATVATELRERPALDAKVLVRIERGEKLERTGTQGGWLKVKARNQEGWVRLTQVKALPVAATTAPPPAAAAPNLANMFTGSSTRPTATTGTRGLTQEQLANAQPAPAEVDLLERYASGASQAEAHARSGALAAQRFEAFTGSAP